MGRGQRELAHFFLFSCEALPSAWGACLPAGAGGRLLSSLLLAQGALSPAVSSRCASGVVSGSQLALGVAESPCSFRVAGAGRLKIQLAFRKASAEVI